MVATADTQETCNNPIEWVSQNIGTIETKHADANQKSLIRYTVYIKQQSMNCTQSNKHKDRKKQQQHEVQGHDTRERL